MPFTAALFDFDGTLADSFAAITASTNFTRHHYGLPALPEAVVREYVGYGLPNLMQELVPTANPAAAVAVYREHHAGIARAETKLIPGVAETIPELARRGLRLAVCSNKSVTFTRDLIAALGLAAYFDAVLGPEDVGGRAKPDPAMLHEGMILTGGTVGTTVYVGDMAIDVHVARAAGLPVWLVPGGAAGKESPAAAGPDRVLTGFAELLDLLRG
ncbi:HAD family hydrolase [Urbifossiella limnaea]|uniref:Phosphoglycolate phosphatase, chromosomal n=1 Tax=Urbifossiella limnaea TaxID=2528023 RepID=A0A517XYP6_9BACT|nr:HAD-IA family hydrolase [Urbifossiella limnaea]QDU22644.1 Phosphoglycolate phosphatase, chromosomal [Urbifossiella limnaea]